MRVAIIGGAGSGLVTAHLLDRVHEVHLFENGVLGIHERSSPTVLRLFARLGVARTSSQCPWRLYLDQDGEMGVPRRSVR